MNGKDAMPKGKLKAGTEYEVGYARPPEGSKFRKGKSGNPNGRPKGAKNKQPALHAERMKAIVMEEAYREITVRDGDKNVTVPMAQAVMRSLAVNAVKGQYRSQRLFAELVGAAEREDKARHDEWMETAITYKLDWEQELESRRMYGITNLPDPVPHPDQIIVDLAENTVRVLGPVTKEEKQEVDFWVQRRRDLAEDLEFAQNDLLTEKDESMRRWLENDIVRARKMLIIIDKLLKNFVL